MNLKIGANWVYPQGSNQLHSTGHISFAFQLTNLFALLLVFYISQSCRIGKKRNHNPAHAQFSIEKIL